MAHRFSFLILFLSPFAVSGLDFTTVFEWDQLDFNWTSEQSPPPNFESVNILTYDHAVFGDRIFVSLSPKIGIPATLSYLSVNDVAPKLAPFPSWNLHEKENRDKMEEVKGLEVDSLGRLWAVDVGSNNSPAKLWIFNLSNGDSVALVHQFSSLVVSYTYNRRDLRKPVLDETANDSLAYIPDVNTNKIVVFSEKRNESWSVQVKERIYFSALALSPKNKRDFVYLGDHVQTYKNLYKIPISNLKKGGKVEVSPSFVGSRNGSSWKMLMDSRGTLYFDVRTDQDEQGRIATWNTNTPFNEEITFQFSLTRYSIAFDTCGNLWLLLWDGRKYQLLKAAVGAKSYLYNDSDAFTACGKRISDSTVGSGNAAIDCSGLRHLNVVLSCWNLFAFFSIGLQIFWFRALTRKKYAILKTKKEQEETYMPADDPANFQRTSFTPGEPIYEEVKPCTSSNSTCLESQC